MQKFFDIFHPQTYAPVLLFAAAVADRAIESWRLVRGTSSDWLHMTPDFIRHCVHVVAMDRWTGRNMAEEEEDMQYVIVAAWLAGSFVRSMRVV